MQISTKLFFALGLLVAVIPSAFGAEHTYPGSMCTEVQNPSSSDERQKLVRDSEGQVFNASKTHVLQVICPIVGPYNDLSEGTANVFVTDKNTEQDVCCEARLNNVGVVFSSPVVCSTNTDTRVQTLTMVPPVFNFTFTSRYFFCTIPPAQDGQLSGIRVYRH
jgi:hypothetical protein